MQNLKGIPASPGIAIGPAYLYLPQEISVERTCGLEPQAEWARLQDALREARRQLEAVRDRAAREFGETEAQIFDAHLLMLSDPVLLEGVKTRLQEGINVESALEEKMATYITTLQATADPYLAARAADLRDVERRLLCILLGRGEVSLADLSTTSVVVARDLTPSDTATLDTSVVLGFCTARGGPTSHTAILARSLGLPAVVGAGDTLIEVPTGQLLIVDGTTGDICIDPDPHILHTYRARRERLAASWAAAKAEAAAPAQTLDGHRVDVVANIGNVEEVETVLAYGGEGVGLLRSEFLYLNRRLPPSEEEQVEAYGTIAARLGERPLVIRTLDAGGDKILPYLDIPREDNPFLGYRAIRVCLSAQEIFKTQLRAILRIAHGHNVKVMFPMVATVEEVRQAKELIAEARAQLEGRGVPAGNPEVGIMIEIPSAALTADTLAREVDFFSIGTNDLTQYTLAADRTNPRVAALADPLHPAVLRLICHTIQAAHRAGIWVGLCGELAGDPVAAPLLLGLGLDEFSMAPPAIPMVKAVIRSLALSEAKAVAAEVLRLEDANAIRAYLRGVGSAGASTLCGPPPPGPR